MDLTLAVLLFLAGALAGTHLERARIRRRVRELTDGFSPTVKSVVETTTSGWSPVPRYLNKEMTVTEVDGSFYGSYGSYPNQDL